MTKAKPVIEPPTIPPNVRRYDTAVSDADIAFALAHGRALRPRTSYRELEEELIRQRHLERRRRR